MSYEYDFAIDLDSQNLAALKRKKKKLNELLDKYGESREAIDQHSTPEDWMEYQFAQGDQYINEILEERRLKRAQNAFPQTPFPSLTQENPNYTTPTNLPETEEETRQKLENNQPHSNTKSLKREASALHKAMQSKTEQEPKEQTNQQSDEKKQTPTKDDNINKDNIIKQIDYSKYGTGFTKEYINEMVTNSEFNQILKKYIIPNEGGYNNDKNDSGGETNMGISQNSYKDEDIKNLTRERANAIYYRDYYKWNGLDKLPYKIRGFIVDFGIVSNPKTAIKITHRVLGIPEGDIIGKLTLDKLKDYSQKDFEIFLEKYKNEMINYFHKIANNHPEKKKFLKGWINRAQRAHLAN